LVTVGAQEVTVYTEVVTMVEVRVGYEVGAVIEELLYDLVDDGPIGVEVGARVDTVEVFLVEVGARVDKVEVFLVEVEVFLVEVEVFLVEVEVFLVEVEVCLVEVGPCVLETVFGPTW
jgi:hypothetical protein